MNAKKRVIMTLMVSCLALAVTVGFLAQNQLRLFADILLNNGEAKILSQKPNHILATANQSNLIQDSGELRLDSLPSGASKIGNFTKTTDLPGAREDGAGVYGDNNWIYQFGGLTDATNASANIYRAKIDPSSGQIVDPPTGTLPNGAGQYKTAIAGSKWVQDSDSLPYGVSLGHRAVLVDGYIYLMGGMNRATDTSYNNVAWIPVSSGFNEPGALLGSWGSTTATNLPETMVDSGVANFGDYIYMMGGLGYKDKIFYSKANPTSPVLSLPSGKVSSNGTTWAATSVNLPIPLARMKTLVLGSRLYVFGGVTTGSQTSAKNYMINLDPVTGDLVGPWQTLADYGSMPALTFASNGTIYMVTSHGEVQAGRINPADGKIAAWNKVGDVALAGGQLLNNASTAIGAGHAYLMGGLVGNQSVYTADLNNGQSQNPVASSWQKTTDLPKAGTYNTTSYLNYVYVMGENAEKGTGNRPDIAPFGKIQRAQFGADGKIVGSWQDISLPSQMQQQKGTILATSAGYLYVFGGYSGDLLRNPTADRRVLTADSYVAKIDLAGNISAWQKLSAGLPADSGITVRFAQGRLYAYNSNSGEVYFADPKPSGDIENWQSLASLVEQLSSPGFFASGKFLYIAGGFDNLNNSSSIVYYNLIGDDGTLGQWRVAGNLPNNQAYMYQPVVANGGLYLLAGERGSESGHDFGHYVRYANFNSDGTLGSWAWQEAAAIPNTCSIQATTLSVGDNTYAIALGGFDFATYYDQIAQSYQAAYTNGVYSLNLGGNSDPSRYFAASGALTNTLDLGSNIPIKRLVWDTQDAVLGSATAMGQKNTAFAQQSSPASLVVTLRSAKDGGNWGQWTRVVSGTEIKIDDSVRYIQYSMNFTASGDQKTGPAVKEVALTSTAGAPVPGSGEGESPWSGNLPSTGISVLMALILAALITTSIYLFIRYQKADVAGFSTKIPRK